MQKRYEKKTMKGKKIKQRRGKEKMGLQGGAPLCAADTNFPKERKKNKRMKRPKKKQRSIFSWDIFKHGVKV